MFVKIFKYINSFRRAIVLKLIFGKKINFKLTAINSIYIGKGVRIRINKDRKLVLGKNVYIDDYCRFECLHGDIYVGDNTFFNSNNNIVSLKNITIGKKCLFGPNVGIFDHNHRYDKRDVPIMDQGYVVDEIIIKDNVWVGTNTTITKGVTITSGTVIGANSIVNKKIDVIGVYGGSPIKMIKSKL